MANNPVNFEGMAMRLAIDFGLHVSTKAYVDAGTMSVEEARGRSMAFWGAFATDQSVLLSPKYR